MSVKSIRPVDLAVRLERGDTLSLLDVREGKEVAICRIEGSNHVPMGDVPGRLLDPDPPFDPDVPIVCICHHGIRSARVAAYLDQAGFAEVYNLEGGIDLWAREVDREMSRY